MIRKMTLALCVTAAITHVACKIPQMKFKQNSSIASHYGTIGKLTVGNFTDKRPGDEKLKNVTGVNSLEPQIWSGDTDPEMLLFFKDKLGRLAQQSKLFSQESKELFAMSGEVYSMKVDRKVTAARYCLPLVDFPKLKAMIHFKAVLRRGDKTVFEKTIKHTGEDDYWYMKEWTWGQVSHWSSVLLEKTMTGAIKKLFDDIDKKVKSGELDIK